MKKVMENDPISDRWDTPVPVNQWAGETYENFRMWVETGRNLISTGPRAECPECGVIL